MSDPTEMPPPPPPAGPAPAPIVAPVKPTSRVRSWARELAIFAAILLVVGWWRTRELPSGPAPALSGIAVTGGLASLVDLKGKPAVVHFWATWCGVCRAEQHNVVAVAEDHAVFSVAVDSGDADDVRAWMEKEGATFPAIVDPEARLSRAWRVPAFPTTFIVDEHGRIRFAEVGYSTELGLRARLLWADWF